MAIALVQSNTGVSTTATTTASFSVAPTSGNLVVLAFAADDYNGSPNAGWTQSAEMEQQTFHGGYLWWRISDGGNSLQYTIGSATNSAWVLAEFSGVDSTPYDISEGQLAQSTLGSYTTPDITPTTGNRLLVAAMGGSGVLDLSGVYTSWLNSFTRIEDAGNNSGVSRDCTGLAYRLVTGNGSTAFSSGATYPNSAQSRSGLIISFKETAGSVTDVNVNVTGQQLTVSLDSAGVNGLPPVFRSEAHTTYASRASVTTVNKPAGVVSNDILLAHMFWFAATNVGDIVTVPSGFTAAASSIIYTSSGTGRSRVWWKRAGGSEPSTYDFTHSATVSSQLQIEAWSGGILSGNPIDAVSATSGSSPNGLTTTAASITTTVDNEALILFGSSFDGVVSSPPATGGWTERYDNQINAYDRPYPVAPGATGAVVHSPNGNTSSASPWMSWLLALKSEPPVISVSVFVTGQALSVSIGTPDVITAGGSAGGPKAIVGQPRKIHRHFFLNEEEEDKKPPAPTKKRVRALQKQVLAEAEGLLGTRVPQKFNPPVRHEIERFWTTQADWDDLDRGYERLLQHTIERMKREMDEDDIETLLLIM